VVDVALEGCGSVSKAERHYLILEASVPGAEGYEAFGVWVHLNLIEGLADVDLSYNLGFK